jgi:hypothetical protein
VAQSTTTPSTRRLSEVARHVVIPSGIETTGWAAVERRCREFGDEFDEWQRGAGRVILGRRADGIYAATVGGVTLSIPRQVAKTFLVGRIVFALCVEFPGLKVLWTAHRVRTATNTFKSLQGFAKRKNVRAHLAPTRNEGIRTANGEQEIAFANGSIIMFGARETGFGRGFDEVDVEVFDEAQILTEKALEDMVAATNQSRHPHGALLFYMGTPPRPVDPGEAFTLRRAEALSGESEDAVYIECSAEHDADPDDQAQWAIANPSFPHRTPLRSMLRLRKNLPSDDSWRREALGIWDDDEGTAAIPGASWRDCEHGDSELDGRQMFAIAVAEDRSKSSIAAAGRSSKYEGCHAEVVDYRPGTRWVIARAAELHTQWGGKFGIVKGSPASSLVDELKSAGLPEDAIVEISAEDSAKHCGQLYDAVVEGRFVHRGQEPLDDARKNAVKRPYGDAWLWSQRKSKIDISPLVAVTAAAGLHGLGVVEMAEPGIVLL